ncbi:MAG: PASTA domain-containing protein, partial [Oscillospiraceae bacterium]
KDGSIKVADFGIAHLQSESNGETPETMGSIHYISPEQVHGDPVDARADIYSLGVVMYEMLTGKLPYEGDTVEAIAVQHLGQMLTLPGDIKPDIPVQLENITLKAMAAEIDERYQSADELLNDLEAFRKNQTLLGIDSGTAEDDTDNGGHKKGLLLAKESYAQRKARSRTVSTYSGFALIAVFLLLVISFLWSFWLKDIFIDSQRIDIPSFVGKDSETVTNSDAYKDTFNFHVVYAIDPNTPEGEVISQDPEAGRNVAVSDDGVDIELTVSAGIKMTAMPDMTNHESREAKLSLEQLGFVVDVQPVASDSITEGYVVSTSPAANEQVAQGATVTLFVSGGPELKQVTMPSIVGKSKSSAISKLTSLNLNVGSISEVEDASSAGTVIWQSIDSGESVAEHTVIYLKVSKGPKESPTPEASEPAETPADSTGGTGT